MACWAIGETKRWLKLARNKVMVKKTKCLLQGQCVCMFERERRLKLEYVSKASGVMQKWKEGFGETTKVKKDKRVQLEKTN